MSDIGTMRVKSGLADMLKGGVIMDVTNAEQARIAEDAGACAVMALERVPADIRRDGGVARMADPLKVKEIQAAVSIPVMAKARIGHFVEAQILEALEVDYIDESEVLTPADEAHHIDKFKFTVPFVCGAIDLGAGAAPHQRGRRHDPHQGRGRHRRRGRGRAPHAHHHGRRSAASPPWTKTSSTTRPPKTCGRPTTLVRWVAENGKLPVVNFSAGGIATPADAALMMQLGAEGVFVGSGIFKSADPASRAVAIVRATTNYNDAAVLAEVSVGLGDAMHGIEAAKMTAEREDPVPRLTKPRHGSRVTSLRDGARRRDAILSPEFAAGGRAAARRRAWACSRCRATSASTAPCSSGLGAGDRRGAPAGRPRRRRRRSSSPAARAPPSASSCATSASSRRSGRGGRPACRCSAPAPGSSPGRARSPKATSRCSASSTSWPGATPSAARCTASRPTSTCRPSGRRRCAPCSSARRGSNAPGRASRCWRVTRVTPWRRARVACWSRPFTRS